MYFLVFFEMKLSKHQKMYVAVLAIVLMALLVDRVFLAPETAGPEEATALPTPLSGKALPRLSTTLPHTEKRSDQESLADRLKAISGSKELDLIGIKDAFRTPQAWMDEYSLKVRNDSPPTPTINPAAEFMQNHRLKAVMVNDKTGSIIIDDRCLFVGQEFDGFTLVSVNERSATFESNNHRVVLTLKREN